MNNHSSDSYLLAHTLVYAQHVCDAVRDMSGIPFLIRKDTLQNARFKAHGRLVVFTSFYGRISGQFFLTLDERTLFALTGVDVDVNNQVRVRDEIFENAEFGSEVLNVAVGRTIAELQISYGELSYLPATIAYGDIMPPSIRSASVLIEGAAGKVQCGFMLNLADVRIGRLLSQAQAKLDDVARAQEALLVLPDAYKEARFDVVFKSLNEAGGDVYDVFPVMGNQQIGYFVGDVSGHTVGTSFITAAMKALLRQNCTATTTASQSIANINVVLCKMLREAVYVTGIYLLVDRVANVATVLCMAHPPVLFVPKHGEARLLTTSNTMMGIFPEASFADHEQISIESGDRFLIITDGLLENEKSGIWVQNYGKLRELALFLRENELDGLCRTIYNQMFPRGMNPSDDVVVMVIEV
jgi:hypothetical protein